MVNFLTWIPDWLSLSCSGEFIYFLMLVFVLQQPFLHWGILIMWLSQFPLTFSQTQNKMPISLHSLCLFFFVDWDSLCDPLRDVPWKDITKLSASAAASAFSEWIQIVIPVYIPHHKYQIKLYCLYQQYKSSESKANFRQASKCCKSIIEPAKLAY